jgi:hypothetical protein
MNRVVIHRKSVSGAIVEAVAACQSEKHREEAVVTGEA